MAQTVTLNGIKRRGLGNWKGHKHWGGEMVLIYSEERRAYWRENAQGYTQDRTKAGAYSFEEAYSRTEHCGPEKKIMFCRITKATPND